MKQLHANWFISAFDKVASQKEVIMAGWKKTGISDIFESGEAILMFGLIRSWID